MAEPLRSSMTNAVRGVVIGAALASVAACGAAHRSSARAVTPGRCESAGTEEKSLWGDVERASVLSRLSKVGPSYGRVAAEAATRKIDALAHDSAARRRDACTRS